MTESGYAASLEIDKVIMAAAGGVELAAGAAAIWPLIIPSPDRFSPSASRPARRPTVRHLRVHTARSRQIRDQARWCRFGDVAVVV
jgi:hypothetical protein